MAIRRKPGWKVLERPTWLAGAFALLGALGALTACSHRDGPSLERTEDDSVAIPNVPPPPADGPRLGAIASAVPVYDRPSRRGVELGSLRAGATVARAAGPIGKKGCDGGWYAIHPRGFVCVGAGATLDLAHPTLVAMALQPKRDAVLPYTYARAVRDTSVLGSDPAHEGRVRVEGHLRARSTLAVVGSWTADGPGDAGGKLRLAMTTEGRFVPAADLEAVTQGAFAGVALDDKTKLPLAFVVKRGVHAFVFRDGQPQKQDPLDYHARVGLTGKRRTVSGVEFWATDDERFVRLTDVTLARERHEYPEFASGSRKWLDVSVVTGTLVAYEGRVPKLVTLVSVGRDRLGAPQNSGAPEAVTRRGEFAITAKLLTAPPAPADPEEPTSTNADAPWVLELASGQRLLGAYWHDRFGIEHGPGDIQLSAADAATVFGWVAPDVPAGWHTVKLDTQAETATIVNVRK